MAFGIADFGPVTPRSSERTRPPRLLRRRTACSEGGQVGQ